MLRLRADFYRSSHPTATDVLLAVEVADMSLHYDRGLKRALYARHRIPEVWIVDLAAAEVEVCRFPDGEIYASITRINRTGTLDIQALPDLRILASRVVA